MILIFDDQGLRLRVKENSRMKIATVATNTKIREKEALGTMTARTGWSEVESSVRVVEAGHVAVDSGQIMIADPCREIKYEDLVSFAISMYEELRKRLGACNTDDERQSFFKQFVDKTMANLTRPHE
jgi:hypothetical protein